MNIIYMGKNSLNALLSKLSDRYATKEIVSTSKPGLVPSPNSTDSNKVLSGNCTWQNESVSLSSDTTFEVLED